MAKTETAVKSDNGVWKKITSYRQFGLSIGLVILLVIAAFITPKLYAPESILEMLRNNAVYGILAVGMMFVLLTGGIDLSVGSTLCLSGVLVSMLMTNNKSIPGIVCLLLSLVIGAACGFVNGFLIGKLGMIPLIATLGTMYIFRGLAFVLSDAVWMFPHQFTDNYMAYAQNKTLGIYNIIWFAVGVFVVAGLFLAFTKPGRRIYAIGTNPESSKVAGINIGNVRLMAYVLCGALAGLAGMLYTSNHAQSNYAIGEGFEMTAISICILGGVSIAGGRGRVDGVVIGTIMMSVISYFISMLRGLSVWQDAIQGAIIIVAVAINLFTGHLSVKRALKHRGSLI